MHKTKIKIALVIQSLADGGAERSCALLSVLFTNLGFEVHTIILVDEVEFDYQGTLFNLGVLKRKDDTILGRIRRFFAFREYMNTHNFDWIIDNRTSSSNISDYLVSRFIYDPSKVIYVVRSYNIKQYFPSNHLIAKKIYKHSPYIITVSDEIKAAVMKNYGYTNVKRIYNPVDFEALTSLAESAESIENKGRYIIAYGRIDDSIKNFSLLIDAYSNSILSAENISLYIVGDGADVGFLKQKVAAMQLTEKVIFRPKSKNPFQLVKNALFTVLSSRYEGFPRVIIESLALGTPVISVDCQSGPKEIIQNEYNGLLVENYNPLALSSAMNRLVEDPILYAKIKANTQSSVQHLSIKSIQEEWLKILK